MINSVMEQVRGAKGIQSSGHLWCTWESERRFPEGTV